MDKVTIDSDDLYSIQAKIHELDGFKHELQAVSQQVEDLFNEANHLSTSVPDIKNVIEEKSASVREDWEKLMEATKQQDHNLKQVEKIRSYFDDYHELVTYLREIMSLVTSESALATDVPAAEEQLNRHKEYKIEIDARKDAVHAFLQSGQRILESGHFMSREVQERNMKIDNGYKLLLNTWQERAELFEHNITARQYLVDAQTVDKWINQQTPYLNDDKLGDSVAEVEEMLSQFVEFENVLDNQLEKINMVKRITDLENHFEELNRKKELLAQEEAQRIKEAEIQKQKDEEKARILREREYQEQGIYENSNFHDKNRNSKTSSPSPSNVSKLLRKSSFNLLGGRKAQPSAHPSTTSSLKLKPVQEEFIANSGFLEMKEFESNDRKSKTLRTWKSYYTVLCGQLLCFFKDQAGFKNSQATSAPISVCNAKFTRDTTNRKRRYVFRLEPQTGSKYLFSAADQEQLNTWMKKISFRSSLAPSEQLLNPATFEEKGVDAHFENSRISLESNQSASPRVSKTPSLRSANFAQAMKALPNTNGHHAAVADPLYENRPANRNGNTNGENGDHYSQDRISLPSTDNFQGKSCYKSFVLIEFCDFCSKTENNDYQNFKHQTLPPNMNRQMSQTTNRSGLSTIKDDFGGDNDAVDSVDTQSLASVGVKKSKSRLSFFRKKPKANK